MDEDQEYADERDALLEKFRESLRKPVSERYFDEDDLIEIFDYAGDLNDDYLRMEALMCGARYFPDSPELLERRGIFYSQYSDDARAQFLSHNAPEQSLILELLDIRNNPPQGKEAEAKLNEILSRPHPLNDEEVIQFIDLASSLGQYDWVKRNMDRLRKKVSYISVLLYEVAVSAEINRDFAFSAKLLEELTEIEPFNSFYWTMLSKEYTELNEHEKALSAIDYALAINPDAPQALLAKAKMLYFDQEAPADEAISLLQRAIDASKGDVECVRNLATIYYNEGNVDEARQLLDEAMKTANATQMLDIIPELLLYNHPEPGRLLDTFYRVNGENNQLMWVAWAQQLSQQGYPAMAQEVIAAYERNSGQKITPLFAIEDTFIDKNFIETFKLLNYYTVGVGQDETDFPSAVAMHIISMIKVGALEKARSLCQSLVQNIDISNYRSVSNRLGYLGLMVLVQSILTNMAKTMDPADWADFDPLQYWH